ncbi:DNA cytosine methyltransferase [Cellulosimicrobium cellulans]|uniref:DNA cytosine methyltransferase n=1 Tax=Cellulosimicrobium cellulans TaxID=1710 RepID=UPI001883A0F2|nr:DNA cytosine methyltransferase [Cellulosimicrobium cellulans]MBE9925060.1 DNA cytosine methyltransferase [Cellulosimicrobium cellulans]
MTAEPVTTSSTAQVETYRRQRGFLEREVTRRDGSSITSRVAVSGTAVAGIEQMNDLWATHELAWLRGGSDYNGISGSAVGIVDLFSGCGGLTVGAQEAARALGRPIDVQLAVDLDADALSVYEANFAPREAVADPIQSLVDRSPGQSLSFSERTLRRQLDGVDIVLGGPPCQGHSSLNNHTRRDDPKNELYLTMARFAEVVRPQNVLIENVPDVVHSRLDVVTETARILRALGYTVSSGVVRAVDLGIPQTRRRHLMVATRGPLPAGIAEMVLAHRRTHRSVSWAIRDLTAGGDGPFDTSSVPSATNMRRMRYLFDHNLHELPDSERPDCHRLKKHTYTSVYGRMYADRPAPTITSGFGSMGQGRFVHPDFPRTVTPHEAARLQGFPDHFSFAAARNRSALARMIGNAVPSRLAYVPVLEMLR